MWAFEVNPASLDSVYWSNSLEDIQEYARLRLSWFQAQAFQQHEVLRIILKQAFGGGKNEENVVTHTPSSKEEAQSMLGNIFKK